MKKIFSLSLILFLIVDLTYSQGPIEKARYTQEDKMVEKLIKLQEKGKLETTFYDGYKKGIQPDRVRFFYGSFGGPFHNGYHRGTQDYYKVDMYNGYNNVRMTLPISFGGGSYYLPNSSHKCNYTREVT